MIYNVIELFIIHPKCAVTIPPLRLRPQLYVSDSFLYIFNVIPSSAKTNNSQIRTLFIFNSLHLRKGSVYSIKTRNICMSSSVLQQFKSITIILSFSTKSWLKNIGFFIKHLSYSQISFDLFIMYYIRTNKLPPCQQTKLRQPKNII